MIGGNEVRHVYSEAGTYAWTLHATADGAVCQSTGVIEVTGRSEDRRSGGRRRH